MRAINLINSTPLWVVSFAPAADHLSCVGGFYWHTDLGKATQTYLNEVKTSVQLDKSSIVRLVPIIVEGNIDTTNGDSRNQLTDFIDMQLIDGIERTWPALRQYIPPTVTDSSRLPTGGVHR